MRLLNEGIRVEEVVWCVLCGVSGESLYEELRDHLFGAPGVWRLWRCPQCGLVWLNPRPAPAELFRAYACYHTHEPSAPPARVRPLRRKVGQAILATAYGYEQQLPGKKWRWIGWLASVVPTWREYMGRRVMFLKRVPGGKLLDVGCGRGDFLAFMRELGWEVLGVEPDPEAAGLAEARHGVPVIRGTLEQAELPESSIDAITLRHVLEHVHDPVRVVRECHRILRSGGWLVVVTPNLASLGHRTFGRAWRGLEPPRHLYLFNRQTLDTCGRKAGFEKRRFRTTSFKSGVIWQESKMILAEEDNRLNRLRSWLAFLDGWMHKQITGEELVMVASRGDSLVRC